MTSFTGAGLVALPLLALIDVALSVLDAIARRLTRG